MLASVAISGLIVKISVSSHSRVRSCLSRASNKCSTGSDSSGAVLQLVQVSVVSGVGLLIGSFCGVAVLHWCSWSNAKKLVVSIRGSRVGSAPRKLLLRESSSLGDDSSRSLNRPLLRGSVLGTGKYLFDKTKRLLQSGLCYDFERLNT